MGKKNKNNYYITNAEIMPEIMHYKETGEATEALGKQIMKIASNLANKANFVSYSWKSDMIGEAVLTCIERCKNFDPSKSNNPYAYLTTICYNSFQAYLNKQKRHSKIKDACYKVIIENTPEQLVNDLENNEE